MLKLHYRKLQQGFTLIEILIVLAIIGILMSVVTLSINAARPSQSQVFLNKLKNSITSVKKFSQNYNKPSKIFFNYKTHNIEFYWLDSEGDIWKKFQKIPTLSFKDLLVFSDTTNIIIKPNGFISKANITIAINKKTTAINLEVNKKL